MHLAVRLRTARTPPLWALLLAAASGSAMAGRPLSVDDANTNDAGAGHVEMWVSRAPDSTVLNVAPAYAPIDGLEFGVAVARDGSSKVSVGTVQLKWRVTPSQAVGCNLGTSLGTTRVRDGGGHLRFLNGLASCNFGGQGSVHLNLGVVKPSGDASVKTWGVAYEREVGPVTPHLELFGEKGAKPTAQVGLRGTLAEAWQLDGTIGRNDGETLYSLGVKVQF